MKTTATTAPKNLPDALASIRTSTAEAIGDLLAASDSVRSLLGLPPLHPEGLDAPATLPGLVEQLRTALAETVQSFAAVRSAVADLCGTTTTSATAIPAFEETPEQALSTTQGPATVEGDTQAGRHARDAQQPTQGQEQDDAEEVARLVAAAQAEWDARNTGAADEQQQTDGPTPANEAEEPAAREAARSLPADGDLAVLPNENRDGTPAAVPVVHEPAGLHRRLTRQHGEYTGSHYYKPARACDLVPGARLWKRGGTGRWFECEYRPLG